jgi:hypothetical protein
MPSGSTFSEDLTWARMKGYAISQSRPVPIMMIETGCNTKPCASGQYHQRMMVEIGRPICVPIKR